MILTATMETGPYLKRVLQTYQLSAPKSLHGPGTVLLEGGEEILKREERSPSPQESFSPPPLAAARGLPILTAPDRSRSERSETLLEGESISCFVVGGEKRLCLPQILNSVLRDFSLQQINQVCDELQIFCSRCNPEQLDELKVSGILPGSAPSCGLITKTDAERLCSALLHRAPPPAPDKCTTALSFAVYHECFGKCKGLCLPELYSDYDSRCIECLECHGLLSPRQFVCHAHRCPENRTCHWGFDSDNWRSYLLLCQDQPELETREKLLDMFKRRHQANHPHKRKQVIEASPYLDEEVGVQLKKAKLEDGGGNGAGYCSVAAYLHDAYYYTWYDAWARVNSAFRPWPTLPIKENKSPVIRDSVPAYLSRGPPVLLHPERVVPLSQSERFERSYQPNVALAPPNHHKNISESNAPRTQIKTELEPCDKDKRPVIRENGGTTTCSTTDDGAPNGHKSRHNNAQQQLYNPEMELSSTDTDDSASEHLENGGSKAASVVEQVAAVFDALSDAKETTRQRVIGLVESLADRISQLENENRSLKRQLEKNREAENQSAVDYEREVGVVVACPDVAVGGDSGIVGGDSDAVGGDSGAVGGASGAVGVATSTDERNSTAEAPLCSVVVRSSPVSVITSPASSSKTDQQPQQQQEEEKENEEEEKRTEEEGAADPDREPAQ